MKTESKHGFGRPVQEMKGSILFPEYSQSELKIRMSLGSTLEAIKPLLPIPSEILI